MKVQTQTERSFLSLSLTLTLLLCMSLSLSSCDNLNQMPRVTELRKRVMVVVMCACVCQSVNVQICVSVYVWFGGDQKSGQEGKEGGRREGELGQGRAKPGVNCWGLGFWGGARVINLLSFVLSVCFHEALVRPKVKAVRLKIVCLLCSMFSPQGWPSHPWDEGVGGTRKELERWEWGEWGAQRSTPLPSHTSHFGQDWSQITDSNPAHSSDSSVSHFAAHVSASLCLQTSDRPEIRPQPTN